MHDLSVSFAKSLEESCILRMKRWAGLYRGADRGTLFRQRKDLGLELTSVSHHYKHLQVVKCCLLQESKDEKVRRIYQNKQERVCKFTQRWSGPKELKNLEPIAEHQFMFPSQSGHAGLGSQKDKDLKYIANVQSKRSEQRLCTF